MLHMWLCILFKLIVYELTWPRVYRGLHACAQVCTRFIADFIACDTRVKRVSHACGVELVANLYHTYVVSDTLYRPSTDVTILFDNM